ncbi:MAG: fasciclin domain-containing protein, partial [Bacteroidales bacterium]|nr:fasciclin domain-containing protein [Bacteroidales bacterium]
MKRILYILAITLSILACTDEIDKSNRFTFTGETVADFLLNRSEKYSHFITLLKRAELFSLLQTWGQYTLFLPDNDAVEKYVQEQDSIYHATKDSDNPVWTGITSPFIEELSDSMVNAIARMHLIEKDYRTAQMGEGAISKWTFNDRMLTINYKVTDERFYIMLNNDAAIIDGDNEVENGIIHLIDKPIDTRCTTVAAIIAEQKFFSIFSKAIAETGFESKVADMIDFSYAEYISSDSRLQKDVPKKKYIKYTAFVEPDEVFHKNGIYTLADLKAFAEKWYGTEDKDDPKSPRNALYKFVAYHFVEGELPYNMIVPSESGYKEGLYNYFFVPGYDLYNYFPTMMGKLMKVLKPLSTADGRNIYINYSKRKFPYNPAIRNHINVRIIELTEFTQADEQYADFVPAAGNGLIHPIDKILIYNEDEMAGNILNERMRFDIAALQPELSSNNLWQGSAFVYFPIDYCKGLKKCGLEDLMHYRIDYGHNGDIFVFMNQYDVAIKIPPIP